MFMLLPQIFVTVRHQDQRSSHSEPSWTRLYLKVPLIPPLDLIPESSSDPAQFWFQDVLLQMDANSCSALIPTNNRKLNSKTKRRRSGGFLACYTKRTPSFDKLLSQCDVHNLISSYGGPEVPISITNGKHNCKEKQRVRFAVVFSFCDCNWHFRPP